MIYIGFLQHISIVSASKPYCAHKSQQAPKLCNGPRDQAGRQAAGRKRGFPRVGSLGASEAPEVYASVSRSPSDTRIQFQWSFSEMKTKVPLMAEERKHPPNL